VNIQHDKDVEARRPNIIVVSKKEDKCMVIFMDIAIPGDSRVHEKEFEKVEKYQDLKNVKLKQCGFIAGCCRGSYKCYAVVRKLDNGLKNWGLG